MVAAGAGSCAVSDSHEGTRPSSRRDIFEGRWTCASRNGPFRSPTGESMSLTRRPGSASGSTDPSAYPAPSVWRPRSDLDSPLRNLDAVVATQATGEGLHSHRDAPLRSTTPYVVAVQLGTARYALLRTQRRVRVKPSIHHRRTTHHDAITLSDEDYYSSSFHLSSSSTKIPSKQGETAPPSAMAQDPHALLQRVC